MSNRTLALALLSLALPSAALAGTDWKALIAKDRVQVGSGKMTLESFQLCKVKVPNAQKSSYQVRTYAEAPDDGSVSRDFLVSFESAMSTVMTMSMGAAAAKGTTMDPLKAFDCDPITAPIGKVDLDISLYVTGEGFQMAFTDGTTGKTAQESSTWDQLGK
jgi:hypothetical protein